jgi:hypothetical protein
MDIKDSQRISNSDRSDETNHPSIICLPGRKQFQEPGEGRRRNERPRQSTPGHSERIESTSQGSQEVKSPDIQYQGLRIDFEWYEWLIVGVFVVISLIIIY